MLTAFRDAAWIALRVVAVSCALAAILGSLAAFLTWRKADHLHMMHSAGIEAQATIAGARVERPVNRAPRYYLDLVWQTEQGTTRRATYVKPSQDYAETFISSMGLTVKTLPIKYLAADPGQFILTRDPWNDEQNAAWILRLAGTVSVICIAGTPLIFLMRRHERRRKQEDPTGGIYDPERLERAGWVFSSLLFYALLVGFHFLPDIHAKNIQVLGAEPFGIPVTLFVILAGTVLYLPAIWVLRHAARIGTQARKDGMIGSKYYLLTGGGHRHLRGSVRAVWLGILYVAALVAAWIAYTIAKGI